MVPEPGENKCLLFQAPSLQYLLRLPWETIRHPREPSPSEKEEHIDVVEDSTAPGVLLLCGPTGPWRDYLAYSRAPSCWGRGGERESGFVSSSAPSFDSTVRGGSSYIHSTNIHGLPAIYQPTFRVFHERGRHPCSHSTLSEGSDEDVNT